MRRYRETIAIKLRSRRKRGDERLHIIEELMPQMSDEK
jgi:hypothetical protein